MKKVRFLCICITNHIEKRTAMNRPVILCTLNNKPITFFIALQIYKTTKYFSTFMALIISKQKPLSNLIPSSTIPEAMS